MELTKQDIQFIDNYLKKEVKYWDIRLEMIDHLASKLEDNDKNIILDKVFLKEEFGPYWKINQNTKARIKLINNKYRRAFFKGFIGLLKSFKSILIFVFLLIIDAKFYHITSYNIFIEVNILIIFITLIPLFFVFIKNFKITNSSIGFDYIFTYSSFFLLVFYQIVFYLFRKDGIIDVNEKSTIIIFSIFSVFNIFWMYNSYSVLFTTLKKYNRYQNI